MAIKNRADQKTLVNGTITTGGSDTEAAELRAVLDDAIDSNINRLDDTSNNLIYQTGSSQTTFEKIESLETEATKKGILGSGRVSIGDINLALRPAGTNLTVTTGPNSPVNFTSAVVSQATTNALLITVNMGNVATTSYQVSTEIVSNGNWFVDVATSSCEVSSNQTSFQFAVIDYTGFVQNIDVKITLQQI